MLLIVLVYSDSCSEIIKMCHSEVYNKHTTHCRDPEDLILLVERYLLFTIYG